MGNYENVLYEVREKVAIITHNNPDSLNALSMGLKRDIDAAMMEAARDTEVRAIIWTANGRAWSAGANMAGEGGSRGPNSSALMSWVDSTEEYYEWGKRWQIRIHKPIVAAVNGYALGRGFEYLLHSDMIIASERAVFGAPEIRHGSIAATRLCFFVPPQWAKRIILTGDHVSAQKAEQIGLVLQVAPHEKLLEEAFALAKRLTYIPSWSMRFNKRMIDGTMEAMGADIALSYSALVDAICHAVAAERPFIREADGLDLDALRKEKGLRAYIQARDEPFGPSPHL